MDRLKVMTVMGTRPEIIRLSSVIKACDKYFNHKLVHTGQNYDYELNQVFFEDLGLRGPDHYLNVVGKNLGETIGNIISKSYDLFLNEKPDAVLILGDTNSALSAISAKRLKIPIFHMEAGNRCFDQNVPEEINRKIVDHISDINMPYTEHSRRYLLSEGFRKEHIYVTGSPLTEVFHDHIEKIKKSRILNELSLVQGKYFLVSMHREENVDNEKKFISLSNTLNEIAEKYELPIIFSTHPRTFNKIKQKNIVFNPLIKNTKPFGFFDYNFLQKNAFCVLSDSGTLSEESSLLRFPGVLIRDSTERPEVLDKGSIVIGGTTKDSIMQSIEIAISSTKDFETPLDYQETNISEKVVKIIQSYVSIINKRIWNKEKI